MTRAFRGPLAAFAFGGALCATAAGAMVVVQKGDGDDNILSVTADAPDTGVTATFICNGKAAEFGVVLLLKSPPASGQDGAEVTIKGDAAVLGQRHFDTFRESLMLSIDGDAGRALFEKVMRAGTVEMDVAGKAIRFGLGDGKAELDRYKAACGL